MINKKYLKSKTLWVALLVALVPIFPEAEQFVKENSDMVLYVIAGVFALLRAVTKDPLFGNEEGKKEIE